MVICQPLALSPCPNLATSGKVNPPTINCAIIAETKRNDDRLVRSLTSPVITPVMAEYGVLLAEYSVISMIDVYKRQRMRSPLPRASRTASSSWWIWARCGKAIAAT